MQELTDLAPRVSESANADELTFETNIIVYGLMAAWYASSGVVPRPPRPNWGSDVKNVPIVVDGTLYSCTHHSRMVDGRRELGIAVTTREGYQSGGGPIRRFWIPLSAMRAAKLTIEAVELFAEDVT